ncbi:uncharacterized protein N7482_002990 [Penicillium canariense]|uniref:Uncharacterized protein n=1 Tax=Penicillium canariense TaxID=189055 RepID=A0A9W9IG82_9EURO|nr:uncharacterized protein N7482_002990 [Penicillium canariense]KAJ5177113.1 hypothetical protein N7482_002990 [Penicillium canariense]
MSGIDPKARKAVNNALISSGSAAVGQLVGTAKASSGKHHENKEARERRNAEEKVEAEEKAAKEKANAAVRPLLPQFPALGDRTLLMC